MPTDAGACIICLDTSPPPIQSGCACRGDGGLAHVECLVKVAASQQAHRGILVWWQCQTCKHDFTGAVQAGMAEAWRSRVAGQAEESLERLAAEGNLADALMGQGRHAEAESMLRRLHEVQMRVLGAEDARTLSTAAALALSLTNQGKNTDAERINREVLGVQKRLFGLNHPDTLASANNLALSLANQGKFADAERIEREVLDVLKRELGPEHESTLTSANNLAGSLMNQGKYAEAEQIQREVLGVLRRVLGPDHPDTLLGAYNQAAFLMKERKYTEAESIQRELLAAQQRVLGVNHPNTLASANDLALSLANQGKFAEAEPLLQSLLASFQRVLGPAHPVTLRTGRSLENVREDMRAMPPTNRAAPASAGTEQTLPAGTRVLVQRLVAKPEHNGKRARVLSFDVRTGRYAVALDDGKELSLKAECVARAGCAAAGCASEEASSVCSRCEAVRHCSRECQRADWKDI